MIHNFSGHHSLAIVVIGRNEGQRLRVSLHSARRSGALVVYVDSGSSDGSPEYAASLGCPVLRLDPSRPFTAARARNEGFSLVVELAPEVPFVQFLDGDCDLVDGWLEEGITALAARKDVAVVCGHVHELEPRASVYNRLCELEWQQTPGEIRSAGGRFLVRSEVFRAVGGFRCDVIAAEDDEFCLRVRRGGWKILHVDAEMAVHDVAMTRFSAWWRRARRTGHAYAQGSALHGQSAERHFVRDCRRIWLWGLALPLVAFLAAVPTHGISLILLFAYPLQIVRIYLNGRKRGWLRYDALLYAWFTVIAKFPSLLGLLEFHWRLLRGQVLTIIEYKGSVRT